MQFEDVFEFGHDTDVLMAMFTQPAFYHRKYARLGGHPEWLGHSFDNGHFAITVRHALDMSRVDLPQVIRRKIGSQLMLHQTDSWTPADCRGRIMLEVESVPVALSLAMHVHDQATGSRLTMRGQLHAGIPLLGRRIEKAVLGPLKRQLHSDLTVADQLAADYA